MSTVEDVAPSFTAIMLPLLKEYRDKLEELCQRYQTLVDDYHQLREDEQKATKSSGVQSANRKVKWRDSQIDFERERLRHSINSLEEFARQISTELSHGTLTDYERIPLQLRLADLESEIRMAESLRNATI